MALDFYFNYCECHLIDESLVIINAQTHLVAQGLRRRGVELARWLKQLKKERAIIYFPGCNGEPYQIPASLSSLEDEPPENSFSDVASKNLPVSLGNMNSNNQDLRDADYLTVLNFMLEMRETGKIVILTSQVDDICIHTNDLLLPERGVYRPHQWRGYNYAKSWDIEGKGQPSSEYVQMRELLETDGFIPNYQYRLIRPDGALCEYQTDYYYVYNYCGEPIRIGVSNPSDWRILKEAAPTSV